MQKTPTSCAQYCVPLMKMQSGLTNNSPFAIFFIISQILLIPHYLIPRIFLYQRELLTNYFIKINYKPFWYREVKASPKSQSDLKNLLVGDASLNQPQGY